MWRTATARARRTIRQLKKHKQRLSSNFQMLRASLGTCQAELSWRIRSKAHSRSFSCPWHFCRRIRRRRVQRGANGSQRTGASAGFRGNEAQGARRQCGEKRAAQGRTRGTYVAAASGKRRVVPVARPTVANSVSSRDTPPVEADGVFHLQVRTSRKNIVTEDTTAWTLKVLPSLD